MPGTRTTAAPPPLVSMRSRRRAESTIIDSEIPVVHSKISLSSLFSNCFSSGKRNQTQPSSATVTTSVTSQPQVLQEAPCSNASPPNQTFIDPALTFHDGENSLFGAASISGIRSHNEDSFRAITNVETYASKMLQAAASSEASPTMLNLVDRFITSSTRDPEDDRAKQLAEWIIPQSGDTSSTSLSNTWSQFYGVYDGHAGARCSTLVAQVLPMCVAAADAFTSDIDATLRSACLLMDKLFLDVAAARGLRDGCTAITVVVRNRVVTVANIGDCRAVLFSSSWRATALSKDQKPNCAEEKARIEAAGGIVLNIRGIPRVNGMLAVARAFGDLPLKRYIVAEPDVTTYELDESDQFIVMATDGLWDVLTNEAVGSFLRANTGSMSLHDVASKLVHLAVEMGSTDNVTVVIVDVRR
ncbi:hypothetical protein Ae201684P_018562 [Aphanomyces euteiches]|uniref:PPM-type phosphatase domain-containing protein n=1 Tax=Aphanomyces euteiches TaxID=100861 RepID=A0A6G0WG73_9STRA|nr:hypothetical protein Ae201684_015776 [Aphanomyces euteiches]KAH9099549.1 hypothetical protein Ae201684P_018562 [Aphanomyces euteiches]KAH9138416.1 hypothetical protein AeRB84_017254 [Aphanomyces euteiches]